METHPLRFLKNLGRSREIATVLLNHGFGDLADRMRLRRYVQWGRSLFTRSAQSPDAPISRAARVRLAFEKLGPTFIKFGQLLSTRTDLLPPDFIEELRSLQENVPPFPSDTAIAIIEEDLEAPLDQLFREFDPEPVAAASLAQVHSAILDDGTRVAVKILRPEVIASVERDLSLLFELANLLERHIPEMRAFDPIGLVQHFSRTIRREMNLLREGKRLREFARMFENDATLYVPATYDDRCSDRILTMEFIDGFRCDDLEGLEANGIDAKAVAENGARVFFKQAFGIGVFHGDPHPGNIRILDDGSLCLLDYGMVGILDDDQRNQLIDLLMSVHRGDVRAATSCILGFGEPFREIDEALLRADVRDFIHAYYGVPLERLNVSRMLTDVLSIISQHGIRIPGDLLMLIRAFVNLEGAGRAMHPSFNLADQLAPEIEKLVKQRYSARNLLERFVSDSRMYFELAHDLPIHVSKSIEKLSRDELRLQLDHRGLDHLINEIDRCSNRLVIGLVIAALLVASALIIRSGLETWLVPVVFMISVFLGMWLIYGIFRSGRL